MYAPCVYIWQTTYVYTAYQCHWHVQLGRRNIDNCHCHALRLSARRPTVYKYLQRVITASCCHAKTDSWLLTKWSEGWKGTWRRKHHSQTKIWSWAIRGRNTKTTVTWPLTLTAGSLSVVQNWLVSRLNFILWDIRLYYSALYVCNANESTTDLTARHRSSLRQLSFRLLMSYIYIYIYIYIWSTYSWCF